MQAGAYPNPLMIWSAGSLGDQGTAGTQQGFFQQPIVTGGKLRVNRARYEVDVEIARLELPNAGDAGAQRRPPPLLAESWPSSSS